MSKQSFSFNSPRDKARYVNSMFTRIAGRYDRMNWIMSLGRDQSWRRRAVQLAAVPKGGRLLDVAVGTGDLALAGLERDPSLRVAGVDFTLEMLRFGQRKEVERAESIHHPPGKGSDERCSPGETTAYSAAIGWTGGDALYLPYPDQTFDAVVSGFMMRNVADIATAFAEQRRVIRPGGRVVCLEMTHPMLPLWRDLYRWVFGQAMPVLMGLLSGQRDAYRYLPASLSSFVNADELKAIMESIGLRGVGFQTMMLGTVAIHVGVR